MAIPALVGILGRLAGSAGGGSAAGALAPMMNPLAGMRGLPVARPIAPPTASAPGLFDKAAEFSFKAQAITQGVGQAAGAMGKLAGAAGLLTAPLSAGVGLLGSFRNSITGLGDQVSQFTALANPALTQKFTHAAEDLTAVIGRGLLPVLEFATRFTRGFADVIQAVSGPMNRLLTAGLKPLGDLIPQLTNSLGAPFTGVINQLAGVVGATVGPFSSLLSTFVKLASFPIEASLSVFGSALELLKPPLLIAAELLGQFAKALDGFVTRTLGDARKLLGIPTAKIAGGSVGAAVKPATIGSVESFQNKVFTQAFSLGTAASGPEERIASHTGEMLKMVEKLPERMWNFIKQLPPDLARAIVDALPELPKLPGMPSIPGLGGGSGPGIADAIAAPIPGGRDVLDAMRRLDDERKKGMDRLRGIGLGLFGD